MLKEWLLSDVSANPGPVPRLPNRLPGLAGVDDSTVPRRGALVTSKVYRSQDRIVRRRAARPAAGPAAMPAVMLDVVPAVVAELVEWLRRLAGCDLSPGLSPAELDRAERVFEVRMPPLWRAVLTRACPVARPGGGGRYPDWRLGDIPATRALVDAPVEGLLFDVERNGFWWGAWGEAPKSVDRRVAVARRQLAAVPRLTPLWGNWYVGPEDDSPVFSIVQADVTVPALALTDLPTRRGQDAVPIQQWPIGTVAFWSQLHAYAQLGHLPQLPFARLARGGL